MAVRFVFVCETAVGHSLVEEADRCAKGKPMSY
jgi:hypothetical protein